MKLYPLTYSQKNILNINNLYPESSITCISGTFKIINDGNVDILKKAINMYVQNNDGIRVRVVKDGEDYFQFVDAFKEVKFEELEFATNEALFAWEEAESKKNMPILDNKLFDFKIVKVKNGDIGFFIRCSHIISDAWTFANLVSGILDYYDKLMKGEKIGDDKKPSFIERIENEKKYLNSERYEKDRKYWLDNLEDIQVKTILKKKKETDIVAKRKSFVLPEKLSEKIVQYCKNNKTSPFNLFLAALSMYIKRVINKEDVIVGTTTLNRSNAQEKEIFGMFVNTCPIRIKIKDTLNFNELINSINSTSLSLLRHQKYPYERLITELKEKYDFKDNLFDIVLNYQNAKFENANSQIAYTTRWHFNGAQIESLIININDREDSGQLIIDYDYLIDIFSLKEIEYLHKHIISLLWHALDNDTKPISKIEMLPEEENYRVLKEFNKVEVSEELNDIIIENREDRNVKAYILDSNKVALPIGVPGELYIDRKINEVEIENPYFNNEKIYNTGKIARWYPLGDIEILGEDDDRLLVPKFTMSKYVKEVDIAISASFVSEPLEQYIKNLAKTFKYKLNINFSGYNQVLQELIEKNSVLSTNTNGINVILLRLEDYIRDMTGNIDEKIKVIKETSEELLELLGKVETATLFGVFTNSSKITDEKILNSIKENSKKILEKVKGNKNIFILDTDNIAQNYCIEKVFDYENDKIAHIPYTSEFYASLSAEIFRKIVALTRKPYKVIVLDCDNTLWKGVCGEVGTFGIEITDEYKELQNFVLQKQKEGFLLTIASKNEISDVLDVFENNPNMILKKDDIVNWKVNWNSKPENLKLMADELNLGLDSFIFLDDNPVECMSMLENLPQVLTLNVPKTQAIPMFLRHLWATDNLVVTAEDRERSKRYIEEQKRKDVEKSVASMNEFIKTLNIKVSMREVSDNEIPRASQMTLRTNQFNLSTIRRSEKEIQELILNDKYKVFVIEANDKFGEYGIVGLLILKVEENIIVDTFLLSCRILGRNIENIILKGIKIFAETVSRDTVIFEYIKTQKNLPILNFLETLPLSIINKGENATTYKLLLKDIPEVKDIEFLYNKPFDKKVEIKEEEKLNYNEKEISLNNYDDNFEIVDDKIIKIAKNKEYLLILKNYTGKRIIDSIGDKALKGEYTAPTNEVEEKLCDIWCEALKIKKVGIYNNFFEIGGDSLSAVFVLSKILREFNVTLSLTDLFNFKTIKEIAELIQKKGTENYIGIPIAPKADYYELSSAQSRMFLINQIEGANTKYNETQKLRILGNLNKDKLEYAFNELIKRHEILRTGFCTQNNKPVQKVYDDIKIKIEYLEKADKDLDVIEKEFVKVFDLEKPPLFRVLLVKVSPNEHIMFFDVHHIVIDGTSFGIFIKEVLSIYDDKQLPDIKVQYKDFAVWQANQENTYNIKKQEDFWLKQFSDEVPVLNLPEDFTRPPLPTGKGSKIYFEINENDTSNIKNICKQTETTMFMFLFAVFNVLLYRYSGQEDIVVGSPVAGRRQPETANMLGMFINNLAIRTAPKGSISFKEYLMQVKDVIISALDNQDYQYEKLVNQLNIVRDMSRNPLFDVVFALQNMDIPKIQTNDLQFEQINFDNGTSKQDISIFIFERDNKLEAELEFSTDLYKNETMSKFAQHYINCIEELVENIDLKIGEFEFLTQEEKKKILSFNDTYYKYDESLTINELFEKQVEKAPNDIAVIFGGEKISYLELNNRANKVAQKLRENGIKSNVSVGVMLERSIDLIVALTGVIKAGGFYVPIDPEYPQDRVEYILINSGTKVLLTQEKLKDKVEFTGEKLLMENCRGTEETNLPKANCSDDIMYTIYTSGSTGNPKGVMLTQKNIVNFIYGVQNVIKFTADEMILGITTVSFDIFVLETWLPLCFGLKIILASSDEQLNVEKIIKLVNEGNVSTIQMTPSRLKPVISAGKESDFANVRNILVGGEPLTEEVFELIKKKTKANIYNMYGPTETAVWSSIADLTNEEEITIGEPIANTQFYVINTLGALQPFNVEGELCIGGDGLAKGYKDREDLTKERFIDNSLIGAKMYKTGDKVKLTQDLKLIFIGRIDNQIKFRGYRIEVQEIESNIIKYEGIDKCIVVPNSSMDQLCAYYVSDFDMDEKRIKEYLFTKLPNYMVPTYFERISELPFTPNGKIDRKKLKERADKIEFTSNSKITGEIQEKLCRCFEKALDMPKINEDENFFSLGGDSLKVIKLTMEIYNEFKVEINYKDVFLSPTISELSKKISSLLINDYKDNVDLGENYSLLNEKKEKNIFAFPPITGYGLAFNDISKYIDDFSLYAFNYIEDEDKIAKYIADIKSIQSKGPYLLLGFSAGADIVMDVAGKIDDDVRVVLMDGFFGQIAREDIEERLKFFVQYSIDYAKIGSENSFLKDILERKIRSYMNYMADQSKFTKVIDADIHFIQSEEMKDEEVDKIAKLTNGKIIKYKAKGNHFDLLKAEFAAPNAQIIQQVFSNI